MKKRILFLILAIALLLSACTGQNDPGTTGNGGSDPTAPSETTGDPKPTDPEEEKTELSFVLEDIKITVEFLDEKTVAYGGGERMELTSDMLQQMGLNMKTAYMTMTYRYVGSVTLAEDTYMVTLDKVEMGLVLESEDVPALTEAFTKYVQDYAPEGEKEYYLQMLQGEYVDRTDEMLEEGMKLVFRLAGNHLSYMEMHTEDELNAVLEFYDNGVVELYSQYYRGKLDEVTEFREDGTTKLVTGYNDDGIVSYKGEHNEHGDEVLLTYYNEDGSVSHTERSEYEYHGTGEIKTYKYYENDIMTTDGEHYANGEIKRRTSYYSNGQIANNWEYTEYGDEELYAYYSEDGMLQHRARWEWVYTENGTRVSCKTYNTNDVLTEESAYHDNGVRKLWLTYDESGNLQGRHEYDEKGNEVYAAWYDAANGTEPYSYTVSEYAEDGRRTSKYYERGKLREETEYFNSGNRKSYKRYYDNGQVERYQEFADYDWFTKEVLSIYYDVDGTILHYDRLEEERYENGNLKSEKHYDQYDRLSSESNYDEQGRSLNWILYDEDGNIMTMDRYEYEFYDDGKEKIIQYFRDDVLLRYEDFYENGMIHSETRYWENGNKEYYREYDQEGNPVVEISYDENGVEIYRYEYNQ